MTNRLLGLVCSSLLAFGPAMPSTAASPVAPRIVVLGTAEILVAPDIATFSYIVRGEGATATLATQAMLEKRAKIDAAMIGRTPPKSTIATSRLSVSEARAKQCDADDGTTRLSTGDCAIKGYVAELPFNVRISPIKDVGTLVALVGSLGGSAAEVTGFEISDEPGAYRDAVTKALASARRMAEAIAAGSGAQLGALISVEDDQAKQAIETNDILVTGQRREGSPAEVMVIDLNPAPQQVSAKLIVTFGLTSR